MTQPNDLRERLMFAARFDDCAFADPAAEKIASHHSCMCGNEVVPYECAWEGMQAESARLQPLISALIADNLALRAALEAFRAIEELAKEGCRPTIGTNFNCAARALEQSDARMKEVLG